MNRRLTLRERVATRLFGVLVARVVLRRLPDFVIGAGNPDGAYLNRWALLPWWGLQQRLQARAHAVPTAWNRRIYHLARLLPNVYVHEFLRDDDDRALHDHPSAGLSFILAGGYIEHTIAAGGVHERRFYGPGTLRYLPLHHAHRIELVRYLAEPRKAINCWTLFVFGPRLREWGFHCPERGWVPWREFVAADDHGSVGRGCD